jgi:hypothetical protein
MHCLNRQYVLSIKWSVFKRAFLDLLLVVALACAAGIVFAPDEENTGISQTGVQTVYCSIVLGILAATTAVRYLLSDLIVYYKERAVGLSSPAYVLAVYVFYFFSTVFTATIFVLILDTFLQNFRGNLGYAVGVTIAIWFCFSGLGFLVGALMPKSVASLASVVLPLLLSFIAGVAPAFADQSPVVRVLVMLSPIRWAVHALGYPLGDVNDLKLYGWSEAGALHSVLFLVNGGVLFHLIAFLLLHFRGPRS